MTETTQDRSLIADKELHYLKDYLSWELLAMKKCADTANQVQDQEMANLVRQVGKKHQEHYNTILNQLKS
ncbi:hypothetical protein [Gorillibacterium sp. sgz5001074]|uniref:hypothetical protein n=1 Tax=Gorillibacterium sp. sgz5001074 TaxID=3446695 RepID=UPI003F67AA5C